MKSDGHRTSGGVGGGARHIPIGDQTPRLTYRSFKEKNACTCKAAMFLPSMLPSRRHTAALTSTQAPPRNTAAAALTHTQARRAAAMFAPGPGAPPVLADLLMSAPLPANMQASWHRVVNYFVSLTPEMKATFNPGDELDGVKLHRLRAAVAAVGFRRALSAAENILDAVTNTKALLAPATLELLWQFEWHLGTHSPRTNTKTVNHLSGKKHWYGGTQGGAILDVLRDTGQVLKLASKLVITVVVTVALVGPLFVTFAADRGASAVLPRLGVNYNRAITHFLLDCVDRAVNFMWNEPPPQPVLHTPQRISSPQPQPYWTNWSSRNVDYEPLECCVCLETSDDRPINPSKAFGNVDHGSNNSSACHTVCTSCWEIICPKEGQPKCPLCRQSSKRKLKEAPSECTALRTSASASHAASRTASHAASRTASHAASRTASRTASHAASRTASHAASRTASHAASRTASHTSSHRASPRSSLWPPLPPISRTEWEHAEYIGAPPRASPRTSSPMSSSRVARARARSPSPGRPAR
jgi:hypothetical protein